MTPLSKIMIPSQEAGCEHPIPPTTPVKETFSDTETMQDQAHQAMGVLGSAPAADTLLKEPSTSEQDNQGESTA